MGTLNLNLGALSYFFDLYKIKHKDRVWLTDDLKELGNGYILGIIEKSRKKK